MYSTTRKETLEHVPLWIKELPSNAGKEIPIVLVGNKKILELRKSFAFPQKMIKDKEISSKNFELNVLFIKTSAKLVKM